MIVSHCQWDTGVECVAAFAPLLRRQMRAANGTCRIANGTCPVEQWFVPLPEAPSDELTQATHGARTGSVRHVALAMRHVALSDRD